jgi:hypothetical protein
MKAKKIIIGMNTPIKELCPSHIDAVKEML